MPIYLYEHPKTKEVKEIVQSVNDTHTYQENGVIWNRVFTVPNASIDTQINPESTNDWIEKTRNKRGTLGEMWDKSAELSEKRAKLHGGKDPVKEKYLNSKEKESGKKHLSRIKEAKNRTYEIEITGKKAKLNIK